MSGFQSAVLIRTNGLPLLLLVLQILSDLLVVCEDLNAPQLENAVRNVRVFADRLEKRLLDRFEAAAMAESECVHIATTATKHA